MKVYQPKVLAFAGSLRKDSYNKKLALVAAKAAEDAGAAVTYIDLADYPMPIFNEDDEAEKGMPETARAFKQLLIEHDGFVIACPEYNGSVTAVLKNAIDWASRREGDEDALLAFSGKTVSLMTASPGGLGGLRGLVHARVIMSNLGCLVLPEQKAVSQAYEAFNEDGSLVKKLEQLAIQNQGSKLTEMLIKLNS
jgi:NAD(P)H-dependent FMN reductase